MTRTPYEIKKGLECCTMPLCAECPYDNEPSCVVKNADGLPIIPAISSMDFCSRGKAKMPLPEPPKEDTP